MTNKKREFFANWFICFAIVMAGVFTVACLEGLPLRLIYFGGAALQSLLANGIYTLMGTRKK